MAATRRTTTNSPKAAEAKAADTKATEAKAEDSKAEDAGVVDPKNVEAKVERNPQLDGGVDKVKEGREADEKLKEDQGTQAEVKKHEKDLRAFVNEGRPTAESWDDPQVNLGNLPANFDPVVSASHEQASHAATVDNGKLAAAAPVQIGQFDNSVFGTNVLDSMSAEATTEVKDGKGSDKSE